LLLLCIVFDLYRENIKIPVVFLSCKESASIFRHAGFLHPSDTVASTVSTQLKEEDIIAGNHAWLGAEVGSLKEVASLEWSAEGSEIKMGTNEDLNDKLPREL